MLVSLWIDSSTGSDVTCSGAGPAVSIYGNNARVDKSAIGVREKIWLFDSSQDLSGIDASSVIYIETSSGVGRNFSRITSTKQTYYSGSDATTTLNSAVVKLGSTSGLIGGAVGTGDVIKIAGANTGGTDLYARITAVTDTTTISISTTAKVAVTNAAWVSPQYVTLNTGEGIDISATSRWAIGGKRASLFSASSRNLLYKAVSPYYGDAMPGWEIVLAIGHYEETAGDFWGGNGITRKGAYPYGPIAIRGEPGAEHIDYRPIIRLTHPDNSIFVFNSNAYWILQGFSLRANNEIGTSIGIKVQNSTQMTFRDLYFCRLAEQKFFQKCFEFDGSSALIERCSLKMSRGAIGSPDTLLYGYSNLTVIENTFYALTQKCIEAKIAKFTFINNIIAVCGYQAYAPVIDLLAHSTTTKDQTNIMIVGNTISICQGPAAIRITFSDTLDKAASSLMIYNNIISYINGADLIIYTAGNIPLTAANAVLNGMVIQHNIVWQNVSSGFPTPNQDTTNYHVFDNNLELNPGWTNNVNGENWQVGFAVFGKGRPQEYPDFVTPSYVDPGASQRMGIFGDQFNLGLN